MSTDPYWRLYVNPMWVLATEVEAVAVELGHQVWHLLADHAGRAGDAGVTQATRDRWKLACDVSVEEVLPWPVAGLTFCGVSVLRAQPLG